MIRLLGLLRELEMPIEVEVEVEVEGFSVIEVDDPGSISEAIDAGGAVSSDDLNN